MLDNNLYAHTIRDKNTINFVGDRMEFFMIAAIFTGFFFALRNIVNKYTIANRMKGLAFFYLSTAITIIAFPIISWTVSPMMFPSFNSLLLLIFASVTYFVGSLIFFYALSLGDVTTAGPILSTRPMLIIPLSFILLDEFYGYEVIAWIFLIVFGAIMTSWNEGMELKSLYRNKTLWLFFTTTFLWAMQNISSKPVLQEIDNFNFTGWIHIFSIPLFLACTPFVLKKSIKNDLKRNLKSTLPYAILANVFLYGSFITMFFAMKFSVSLSEALIATHGVFIVILGFIISQINPKLIAEKHTKQTYMFRLIGAVLIFIGAYNILV
ncbi:MAG: DMT family transporter [Candidatus Bathyarchaeota archaeon]|nr:DMT family transporter [Candidatus Bathyarchaeota archaeon]